MIPALRVVIVEDSPTQRAVLRRTLEADGDIVVVGEAMSAAGAIAAVRAGQPDVVTVDLHIPGGGGEAIDGIMKDTPRPILLFSGELVGMREAAIEAMGAGAAAVLAKPRRWDEDAKHKLRSQVRSLRGVHTRTRPAPPPAPQAVRGSAVDQPIVAIAASTGGPAAVCDLLRDIHGLRVPVLLVQHIDPRATASLVNWMQAATGWRVVVANHGDVPEIGTVHAGPGGRHLELDAAGRITLTDGGDDLHRPSADRLFTSLARHAGPRTIAVVLTGMGRDGAEGALAVKQAGGMTFAQDDQSSAVYGMPRAAAELDAVRRVLPLGALGGAIRRAVRGMTA